MKIAVEAITSAVNKVCDLTSGDKTIPGILLVLDKKDDDNGELKVCYSDGHKSMIEVLPVEVESSDYIGTIAVPFEMFTRAIASVQPSGIIKVKDVQIDYLPNNIIRVSAVQFMNILDESGNIVDTKQLGKKQADISWVTPGSDPRSSLLVRMKYDTIFESESTPDIYPKAEFIDALSRTSCEKGKNLYVSRKNQCFFVANQAHLTCVPISENEPLTLEQQDELRGEMIEAGTFESEEKFAQAVKERSYRISHALVIPQNIAKSLIGILNKTNAETVAVEKKDARFCTITIEDEDETLGIWFEMATQNKAHTGTFDRYQQKQYKTYQVTFIREVLANNIKSACEAAKNDKTVIKFEPTILEGATCNLDLVISSNNFGASISDTYRVNPDDIIGNIEGAQFTIGLKVFSDMLAQLKTDLVALDFDDDGSGAVCVRLAEVDITKLSNEYCAARLKTKELCEQQGIEFKPDETPTPVELKLDYRKNVLKTIQYTMLSK